MKTLRFIYYLNKHITNDVKNIMIIEIKVTNINNYNHNVQICKFSDFCLISENFTSKYLKMFFEISSL